MLKLFFFRRRLGGPKAGLSGKRSRPSTTIFGHETVICQVWPFQLVQLTADILMKTGSVTNEHTTSDHSCQEQPNGESSHIPGEGLTGQT